MAPNTLYTPPLVHVVELANDASRGHPFQNLNFSHCLDENFQNFANASECILTHPDASECIRAHPNRSEQIQKLRKTCEHFEKFVKHSKQFAKFSKKTRDRLFWFVGSAFGQRKF